MSGKTTVRAASRVDRFAAVRRAAVEALEARQLMSASTSNSTTESTLSPLIGTSFPSAALTHPTVTAVNPANGSSGFVRDGFISAEVTVPNGGIKPSSLTSSTVFLKKTSTGDKVPAVLNTTGGGDAIILRPTGALEANTSYTFVVTNGLKDSADVTFAPFTATFTTGSGLSTQNTQVKFEQVELQLTNAAYTSLAFGPDGKLYASDLDGVIRRWTVNAADGTLSNEESFDVIAPGDLNKRFVTGILFDPASTASKPILWVNNGAATFTDAPNWSGKLTRLSDGSDGSDFGKVEDKVVGLPRASKDHLNEQMVWGPDGAMYFAQGAMSSMGAPDAAWGNRPEEKLSAAILRVNVSKLPSSGALNVQTRGLSNNYDPSASGAAVTVYASGVRNAYDLVWASNGHLYAPTNGSATGGNAPAGGGAPALTNLPIQTDYLFDVQKGKYYGHPNPTRNEFVAHGGNPTAGADPGEVAQYPVGTMPDADYAGFVYNFGVHTSPNGVIEYQSNAFNGALKNKLLVVRYSGQDDIVGLLPTTTGGVESVGTIGGATGFNNPLDLVEDTRSGFLYVAEFGPEDTTEPAGGQKITLLRPVLANAETTVATDIGNLTGKAINSPSAGSLSKPTASTIRMTAAGANIDKASDGFYFASQQRSGDFDVRVRVDSLTQLDPTTKAGLMARASLNSDAVNVFQSTTANDTFRLSYRDTDGALTTRIKGPARTMPGWLRLVRDGNTFVGYHSADGTTWTETGRVTMTNMPPTVYLGLAASSATAGAATTTADFSQLSSVVVKPVVTVVATDADAAESGADNGATYTVTRTGSTLAALTVKYAMTGTATNGTDYALLTGTVTIPAGASSATVVLAPTNDADVEGSETAVLTLTSDESYLIGASSAGTVTIADNGDAPPVVGVVATTPLVAENAAAGTTGVFTFTRNGPLAADLVVNYTLGGSAAAPADYAALTGTVTIPAGQSSATVAVAPVNDAAVEGDETVVVTVAAGTGYAPAAGVAGTATVTIGDDDQPPTVSVVAIDGAAAEAGQDVGVYRVSRTGPTGGALGVVFNFGGSAVSGTDFTSSTGALTSVTIPDGASFADVTITPVDDAIYEGSETATLTIAANGAYAIGAGAGSAAVTITDNDPAPVVLTGVNINNKPTGTSTAIDGGYQVTAGGNNLSNTADGLRLLYRRQAGDFDVSVKVDAFTASQASAKAGLMAREALTAGSRHVSAVATKGDGFRTLSRLSTNGNTATNFNAGAPDYAAGVYLRLKRVGNTFTSYYGTNGTTWTQMAAVTMALPSTVYLGLATTSGNTTTTATAKYLNFGDTGGSTQTPLAAPANLVATAQSSSRIDLAWAAVTGATGYHVQRRVSGQSTWTDLANTTGPTYSDTGLSASTAYEYRVNATDGTRTSAYGATASATTQANVPTGPAAPGKLVGQANSDTEVALSWDGDEEGTTTYRVQYRLASAADVDASYTLAGTVNDVSFPVSGLTANTVYIFRVRAEAGGQNSAWVSVNVSTLAEPQLVAPTGVTATPQTGPTRVVVSWSAVAGATLYRVQRKLASQSDLSFADVGTTTSATTLTDSAVTDGTSYVYRVRAEKGANLSPYSDPATATTAAAPIPLYSIGAPAAGASVTAVSGGYDVVATGADIYGTADAFQLAANQRTGNFDVMVRVDGFTAPDPTAKAGLMARDTLDANSRNVFSGITDGDGFRFSSRAAAGGSTTNTYKVGTVVDGAYVRLKREGNVFTAYYSTNNGASWTSMGSVTVALSSTVFLGFAQSSKSTTGLTSAAQYRDFRDTPAQPAQATISWSAGPSVPLATAESGTAQIGNKLYVVGGYASGLIGRRDVRVLNLDTQQWTTLAPLPPDTEVTHFGMATDGKFIYVIGGQAGNGGSTDMRAESWKYNIATNTWSSFTALPAPRGGGGLHFVNGQLHYFSGFLSDRITHATDHWAISVDANGNPTTGWVRRADVPRDADHFGIAEVNGIIYLIGGEESHGEDYVQHNTLQAYNPVTDTWAQKATLPVGTSHFEGSVQVINGRILMLGGIHDGNEIIGDGWVYNPATNSWSEITDLPYARKGGISAWWNGRYYYGTGNGYNGTNTKAYQTNGWWGTINNLWPAP